ncbi:MAG: STAS domain-containing protein [Spirochaetota bacterium]
MAINFEATEKAHFITLTGDVDLYQAEQLKQEIFDVLAAHPDIVHLCIDLSKVSYLDSSGIGVLVVLFSRLKKNGKRFSLCGIGQDIKPVFNTSMLDKFFPIFPSRTDVS